MSRDANDFDGAIARRMAATIASRRRFMQGAGALAAYGGLAGATGGLLPSAAWAQSGVDTIYSGGPILTMDDANPTAEAVLVRGGRIMAAGTRVQIDAMASGAPRLVDLDGRTMIPGFFDAHGHVTGVGLQSVAANMLPAPDGEGNSVAALQRLLRDWAAQNRTAVETYNLIIGFGYDDSQLAEQRHPTNAELDAVSTDHPVIIIHQSSHMAVVNSRALEIMGIGADTPNPDGGQIGRIEGGGEPNGLLQETAFFANAPRLLQALDAAAAASMVEAGANFCARFGYTTVQDARSSGQSAQVIQAVGARGGLPVDVLVSPDILTDADYMQRVGLSRDYENRVRIGSAKLTIDGSPQGKTAWYTQPYYVPPAGEEPDYAGFAAVSEEGALAAVDLAFANDWQILCHTNGDAAIDLFVRAVRESAARHGASAPRRPVMIHGQSAREDQIDAMNELGIIPSLFPMHTFYWGDWHRDSVLGPERADNISPTGWAMERDMVWTTHHDAPVANPDSMRVLSATVTRRTRSGDILGPMHRVPVRTALKAMTLWAAYQHFEEGQKGSIETGKIADFAILSDNPETIDESRIADISVTETIKDGETVYEAT